MHIVLKSFDTKVVDVAKLPGARDLKVHLGEVDGLPLDSLQLIHGNQILPNDFEFNSLPEGAVVEVSVPLLGGKVHGSLTRAGKVKNQTPKVAKQEKKKKVVGRAHRRWQYNKRFVAVTTVVGGRRRGPNSNMKT